MRLSMTGPAREGAQTKNRPSGARASYDLSAFADGRNITTDHRGRTQTYDIDNRLLTVAGLSGGTATYAYTAAGNLHQKSYSGVTSKIVSVR